MRGYGATYVQVSMHGTLMCPTYSHPATCPTGSSLNQYYTNSVPILRRPPPVAQQQAQYGIVRLHSPHPKRVTIIMTTCHKVKQKEVARQCTPHCQGKLPKYLLFPLYFSGKVTVTNKSSYGKGEALISYGTTTLKMTHLHSMGIKASS